MPLLVQETTIVEGLMDAVFNLHFCDAQKNRTSMDIFGDNVVEKLFYFAQSDLELVSVIESKYLSYFHRSQDISRVMKYFKSKF